MKLLLETSQTLCPVSNTSSYMYLSWNEQKDVLNCGSSQVVSIKKNRADNGSTDEVL